MTISDRGTPVAPQQRRHSLVEETTKKRVNDSLFVFFF